MYKYSIELTMLKIWSILILKEEWKYDKKIKAE